MAYRDDGVILLHGIARGSRSMGMMDRVLRDAGYKTLNLDYPSRYWGLEELAARISAVSQGWIDGLTGRVHFVTHSMGGLVARAMITRDRPEKLGRVVMLGPPNQGSEIADMLSGTILYERLFGPAGAQLATRRPKALAAALGIVDFPLGIIAGKRSIDPLSWLILPKPNDGKVTVEGTKTAGMSDHLVLPTSHALMMRDPAVLRATLRFLGDGRFGQADGA